jgi:hypothetical protein
VQQLPPQCRPRLLTPEQEQTVRAALAAGESRDRAAALAGISRRRLDSRLRDQLADVRVGRGRGGGRRFKAQEPLPPSREEIRMRSAFVRENWGPERWGVRPPDLLGDREPGRHGKVLPAP